MFWCIPSIPVRGGLGIDLSLIFPRLLERLLLQLPISCPQDQTLPKRSNNPFVILPAGASALLKALIDLDIEHSGD